MLFSNFLKFGFARRSQGWAKKNIASAIQKPTKANVRKVYSKPKMAEFFDNNTTQFQFE